jgi:lysophospholipase L1-like esterase
MSLKTEISKNNKSSLFLSIPQRFNNLNALIIFIVLFCFIAGNSAQTANWVGTWSTAPQLVEPNNNPPSPGLSDNTIRQIARVSLGGDSLRIRFSNEFSTSPVTMHEVHIAVSTSGLDTIDLDTDKTLSFNGEESITMDPGLAVTSDPVGFDLEPLTTLAITIYFGTTSSDVTGHPGSRTTSYILTGNAVSNENFSGAARTDHWYVINTIDVSAPDSAAAVAILGNSITDGRGSGTNKQNRWPDELANRLQANPNTRQVSVLNEGIGGNCVLRQCLGPSALSRFGRDVLQQNGVRWLIILEGINDIGGAQVSGIGEDIISAYRQMIHYAHLEGIFVYGATLLPFGGSSYYSDLHETERQIVNEWIRNSGEFDAVIDLEAALEDPENPGYLLPEADDGDGLHPSETGHRMMAEAVDLSLFLGRDTLVYTDESQTIYFEPECAVVGENWDIVNDAQASNGKYVTVKSGTESLTEAPSDSSGYIIIPFSVDSSGYYSVFGRINCPTYDDDSFWIKTDENEFIMYNGLVTSGWQWMKFDDYMLSEGEHILTIAYREDGAKLDKIAVSNSPFAPQGMGDEARNLCNPTAINSPQIIKSYALWQNYPNPFNPSTNISFSLPEREFVTLKVYNILGQEVMTLINEVKAAGEYHIKFNGKGLVSGTYFYELKAGDFSEKKKMILLK